jgi:asparagine N-glycosylation enzyme membrane subunit Stt3
MTLLTNTTLFMPNSSIVFASQNAYTSMELYYAFIVLFTIFIISSLFLDGRTKPFEKLFASILAFLFSLSSALASFSLALLATGSGGSFQQEINNTILNQQVIIPTIIMQNITTWQVINWILVILCFINIINCILVLIDNANIPKPEKPNYTSRRYLR